MPTPSPTATRRPAAPGPSGWRRLRPALSHLDLVLREAEALGNAVEPGARRSRSSPTWTDNAGSASPWTATSAKGVVSLALHGNGLQRVDGSLAGLLVDEWTEIVPNRNETTGIAFRYDPPDAAPPQAILLAVPPVEGEPWTVGTLNQVLLETLDLAHLRACGPDRARRDRALPARRGPGLQPRRRRGVHRPQPPDPERGVGRAIDHHLGPTRDADRVRRCSAAGMAARLHDPLWLLARQWQVGEFQAEDGGTPVVARWRGTVSPLTRYHLGPIPPDSPADSPEVRAGRRFPSRRSSSVNRSPCRCRPHHPATACDSGWRPASTSYACWHSSRPPVTTPTRSGVPTLCCPPRKRRTRATASYVGLMAGRALDGRRLQGRAAGSRAAALARTTRSTPAIGPRSRTSARPGSAGSTSCSAEPDTDAGGMAAGAAGVRLLRGRPDGRVKARRTHADRRAVHRRHPGLVLLRPQRRGRRRHHAPGDRPGRHPDRGPGPGDPAWSAGSAVLRVRGRPARPRRPATGCHRDPAAADGGDDQRLRQRLVRDPRRPARRDAWRPPGRSSSPTPSASPACCGRTATRGSAPGPSWSMYSLAMPADPSEPDAVAAVRTCSSCRPPSSSRWKARRSRRSSCSATRWPTSPGRSSAGWRARWSAPSMPRPATARRRSADERLGGSGVPAGQRGARPLGSAAARRVEAGSAAGAPGPRCRCSTCPADGAW